MSRKTILHITPFIWTMGFKKGIFGVQAYALFEKFGYHEVFITPDINLFSGMKNSKEMLKKAKLDGTVFKFGSVLGASTLVNTSGKFSFLNKLVYFLLYMFICFFVCLKTLSRLRNVVCIYAHTWTCVPQGFLLGKLFRIPCVYRVYGIHNYELGLTGTAANSLLKPDLLIFKIPCDAYVITNDGTMGKSVAMRMGVSEDRILYVFDGVPKDFFTDLGNVHYDYAERMRFQLARTLGLRPGGKIVLYVGRLVYWKGIDRLIRVLHSAREKKPETDMCLIIAGDGDLRYSFEKLVEDLDLKRDVFFLGSVERGQLKGLLASCDVYLTLQDLTNLSNSLLEAMAQGRCVVAGDVGGTREVIENMTNGVLVSLSDEGKIASVIVDLLLNNNLRRSIEEGAKEYAKTHFLVWDDRIKFELDWISKSLRF